jgi:hypothetical protein
MQLSTATVKNTERKSRRKIFLACSFLLSVLVGFFVFFVRKIGNHGKVKIFSYHEPYPQQLMRLFIAGYQAKIYLPINQLNQPLWRGFVLLSVYFYLDFLILDNLYPKHPAVYPNSDVPSARIR